MEIQTKYHGVITLVEKEIITFERGIPGFPEEDAFVVLPLEEDSAFSILQSTKTGTLAFVLINPFHYFPEYDFTIEDQIVEKLDITSSEDIIVYTILTIQEPFENTTTNLQAPVIINTRNQHGKQVILNNDKYTTRHRILEKR